jgi:hypothetical protein
MGTIAYVDRRSYLEGIAMSLLVRTCSTDRMNFARIAARAALLIGATLWVIMLVARTTEQKYINLTYSFSDVLAAGLNAIVPLAIAVGVFVLALFYERLAAVVLLVVAAAVVVWGAIVGWDIGVWISMMVVMVLPLVISAVLLLLAASTQRVCELERAV